MLNFELLKNPINWVIVFLMVYIGLLGFSMTSKLNTME